MNITEYIENCGGTTFGERPVNQIDALIFSELTYLNYTGVVGWGKPAHTLQSLAEHADELTVDNLLPKSNRRLLEAAAASERFKDVKVGYFSERNDETKEIRYASVTFVLPDGAAFVAFRGTDITILGWKEDFNMAFRRKIPSQELAVDYLNKIAAETEGGLYVCGHSKGGNLAVYASVFCDPSVRSRIIAVYNNDGPGFHDSIFELGEYKEIEDRIYKTLPHDSLIGILLFHTQNYKVVRSKSVLIGQHNPFAWSVEDENSFEELPDITANAKIFDNTFYEFIGGMEEDDRRKFVDALFTVIGASGAKTIFDFKDKPFGKLHKMRMAFTELSDESKKLVLTGGKQLLKLWFRSIKDYSDE